MLPLLRKYRTVYAVCTALQAVALPLVFRLSGKNVYPEKQRRTAIGIRTALHLFLLILIPLSAIPLAGIYYNNAALLPPNPEINFMNACPCAS